MDSRTYLWVALGGGLGACARYAVVALVASRVSTGFPAGTLLVNLSGSFAIGAVATLLLARGADPAWRLLLVTGLLGGYTTFSAFSLELLALLEAGRWPTAALYALASTALGLAACAGGAGLARLLLR